MDAGKLNQRISIYAPLANSGLRSIDDFSLLDTVWADVRAVTAREQIRSGVEVQSGVFTVMIRYLRGITMDCVIKYGDFYYSIDSLQVDPIRAEITLAVVYHANLNQNTRLSS